MPETSEAQTYRKVARRILPILFVCYVLAYLDRINVGFAKLQMQQDLGMSDRVYGTGAGIFFIGYFLFEVPANIALQRVGAKRWLSSIMALWGLLSAATMFVRLDSAFYLLRFLLGAVEAGFFPGVILFLTFWYPRHRRARAVAAFMAAIPLSGVIGGPLSGWILSRLSSFGGLRGWQWLYLLEGLPSVLAGAFSFFLLDNGPRDARWLTAQEKAWLTDALAAEEKTRISEGHPAGTLVDAFRNPAIWLLSAIYFGFVMGSYGIGFWLPQVLKDKFAANPWHIGLLSTIPWGAGVIAMVVVARHGDRRGTYRKYIIGAGLTGGVAFAVSSMPQGPPVLILAALTVATAAVMVTISAFWSLPTDMLSATAAGAGIAWINSLGNLAGYVCPFLVGWLRDRTHSMTTALLMLAGSCMAAAVTVALLQTKQAVRAQPGTALRSRRERIFNAERFGVLDDR